MYRGLNRCCTTVGRPLRARLAIQLYRACYLAILMAVGGLSVAISVGLAGFVNTLHEDFDRIDTSK